MCLLKLCVVPTVVDSLLDVNIGGQGIHRGRRFEGVHFSAPTKSLCVLKWLQTLPGNHQRQMSSHDGGKTQAVISPTNERLSYSEKLSQKKTVNDNIFVLFGLRHKKGFQKSSRTTSSRTNNQETHQW